ncbi:MAG: hypothetical protein QCI82_01310 [Candidatus Thermoplasmatota archaeon]|nr:hypothetical protein [Candidatus Thermoplasmatota archaeon]
MGRDHTVSMGHSGYEVRRYEAGIEHVLFVMGWGNDFDQPGILWFLKRLKEMNYSVTAVRIPVVIRDFKREVIDPVWELTSEGDPPILVAHSMGCIAGRYMEWAKKRIFLSPFWGIPEHRRIPLMGPILSTFRFSGIPLFYRGYERPQIGDITTEKDMEAIPRRISLRTIYQFRKAQVGMPPPHTEDTIYYSRSDNIIDTSLIEGSPCRKSEFEGGHAFFTSSCREKVMRDILYDLRGGNG